jgi:dipeptidase E
VAKSLMLLPPHSTETLAMFSFRYGPSSARCGISRRECLRLGGLAGLAGGTANAVAAAAERKPAPVRRIFVVGGALLTGDPDHRLLRFLVSLTGKPNPVVYDLPTASGDNLERVVLWYEIMNDLPCRPRHLRLFGPTGTARKAAKQLLAADAIVVPGGNGLNMIAVWKAQGVDAVLRTAWERGILLAGESAGMNCWFEQAVGDSRPEQLRAIDFLGWLKGSACPHYHDESARWKKSYHQLLVGGQIKDGIACDSGAGVLFEGQRPARVVTLSPKAGAYRVRHNGKEVVEEPLKAEILGKTP